MYPGTIFELIDQSQIEALPIAETISRPFFMCGFTSDKGPEEYTTVEGKEFFDLYGNDISFARHGQPLLQAAAAINAGGKVYAKRVVAPDSTLANNVLVAEVSSEETQKTNADGQLLYTDADGNETTEAQAADGTAYTPIMQTACKIKYVIKTATGAKSVEEVHLTVEAALKGETPAAGTTVYPLFCFADNGRGLSKKKWLISPDYVSSKSSDYTKYMFTIMEGNYTLQSIQFALDPNRTDLDKNISLQAMLSNNSKQLKCLQYDNSITEFIAKVAEISGIDATELNDMDVLFGSTKKGETLASIKIDADGINLSHPYGQALAEGSNGTFGNAPMEASEYEAELAKVWTGEYSDEIYNLDSVKIDVVMDANYPAAVKSAIEAFVTFREDCMYFGDLGLGLTSFEAIEFANRGRMKNKFCTNYSTSYEIIDPYSKKQIPVTICYDLTKLMVPHFAGGRNRPLAGSLNNFVIADAIKGTVNFIPVITPSVNQKELMEEARINYASYYDDELTVESLYTSQEKLTQFSYSNNILAIQEVIKAVRSHCPRMRYSFIDGDDLEKYKKDVQTVLDRYSNNFISMTLEYIADTVYISNKIFYAAIKVQFRNFIQTEYFKVIALPS